MYSGVKIVVNVAQSLNGIISGNSGRRVTISDKQDLKRVHMMRANSDAILVGANTIINDNPDLKVNPQHYKSDRNPARVVLDENLRIPDGSRVLDASCRTIIFTTNSSRSLSGAEIIVKSRDELSVKKIVAELSTMGIHSILVEGGAQIISEFLSEGIVDEFYLYIGNVLLPESGVRLFCPDTELRDFIEESTNLGNGILVKLDPAGIMVKK